MFIFYFLGVRLPCCLIFWQFWLCEEAQCVYLRHHLGSLFPVHFSLFHFAWTLLFPLFCHHPQQILWASWLPVFWTLHLRGWLSLHLLVLFWSIDLVFHLGHIYMVFVSAHLLSSKRWSFRYSPGWGNPSHCVVTLYVGEGSEREQGHLLSSQPTLSPFPCYRKANWTLLVLIPWGWVCVCSRAP